ncbi:hypothetical protein NLJ89_g8123 [Agrocybe chaxingu]|uniref:Uncharacterized protein n=1 Tax=Agrocybe chaxingu TaxID=84603 RepID=A0A9W8MT15_9AGAR|nr:hypothetical protein NLJ89_g8123 [Agrocybe chaxingu]
MQLTISVAFALLASTAIFVRAIPVVNSTTLRQNALDAQKLNVEFQSIKPSDACKTGAIACVDNAIADCVDSKWDTKSTVCPDSVQCFALPSPNAVGTALSCTSRRSALSIMELAGVQGGMTGSDIFTDTSDTSTSAGASATASGSITSQEATSAVASASTSASASITASGSDSSQAPPSTITSAPVSKATQASGSDAVTVTVFVTVNGTSTATTTLSPEEFTSSLSAIFKSASATLPPSSSTTAAASSASATGSTVESTTTVSAFTRIVATDLSETSAASSATSASAPIITSPSAASGGNSGYGVYY